MEKVNVKIGYAILSCVMMIALRSLLASNSWQSPYRLPRMLSLRDLSEISSGGGGGGGNRGRVTTF